MAGNLDKVLTIVASLIEDMVLRDTVRITAPATGAPVFNPATGQLEYPVGVVLYEGPGAIQGSPSLDASFAPDAGQPWVQETRSPYRLLTPLPAAVAPKDAIVEAVAVHDPTRAALLGRTFMAGDPGVSSTLEAVRVTPLDQQRAPQEGTP
ncbi:DUF6093 family protein [Streptomyces sp. NPDC088348]|uniref:DUF6093 family protein n=1 Tax=Streptomyces sp. NPDC088348 TaxID=3365853 RepID=UPI00382076FF